MNNEEAKEKFNAINNRSRAKLGEIIEIASKAFVDTAHPGGYEPGQYGQDYRTFGAAIAKIRQICKKDLSGDFPDYEWMAGMMMHGEFKPERLAQEIEALASERPIDYPPTYFTPGWLVNLVKAMEAGRAVSTKPPTDDELHEAATEEPTVVASAPSPTLPSGADGTPPAEEEQQPELRPVRPQTLDGIGMQMDKRVSRDANGKVVRIDFAGIRHLNGTHPFQIWEIYVSKHDTGNDGTASHISVLRDHELIFSGTAFFGLEAAAEVAISMMIRKIIGDTAKKYRDRFRKIRKPTGMTKAAQAGEVA